MKEGFERLNKIEPNVQIREQRATALQRAMARCI
jgi:hypothetical protein